ncbi:hypothetical protein KAR91_73680 [Candidatus Pacearchaeota archaeon]|nr:hypothetical protein [Candidatus Pacearchaeota archaeon]
MEPKASAPITTSQKDLDGLQEFLEGQSSRLSGILNRLYSLQETLDGPQPSNEGSMSPDCPAGTLGRLRGVIAENNDHLTDIENIVDRLSRLA